MLLHVDVTLRVSGGDVARRKCRNPSEVYRQHLESAQVSESYWYCWHLFAPFVSLSQPSFFAASLMSARITRKRARLNSNGDGDGVRESVTAESSSNVQHGSEVVRRRDKEFWYSDGTIILVAGDVEFRVYKGILSENSPVFSDMFSFPQPPIVSSQNTPSTGEDCPLVHLPDSAEDLRHVLRVYMPNNHARYVPCKKRLRLSSSQHL